METNSTAKYIVNKTLLFIYYYIIHSYFDLALSLV